MTFCSKYLSMACASLVGLVSLPAPAAVIDFEDLPHADELSGAGTVYFSKGFTFTYRPAEGEPFPVGFMTVGPSWQFNGRSAALVANSCSATTTLSADDNNPLTLRSIDLAALNGDTNVSVVFSGITVDGGTVKETIVLGSKRVWKTYHLPGNFRNLQSVTWKQGDCFANPPHMFDNVRVRPTWKEDQAE